MQESTPPPVVSGANALGVLGAFLRNPVSTARKFHGRFGKTLIVKPPFSSRKDGRQFFVTACSSVAERVLNDPERFRTVGVALTRGPKHSAQRRLRNGIVRMNGQQQRALRRAYAPPLTKNNLSDQQDRITDICRSELAKSPRGVSFDAGVLSREIAKRTAADILFASGDCSKALAVAEALERHSRMQYSLRTFLFPFDLPGTPYRSLLKHAVMMEQALIGWIQDEKPAPGNLVTCVANMSDVDVDVQGRAAQLWTLFGASFHTTATSLRWTLLHLAWNEPVQSKLIEEIRSDGIGSKYIDAVILESLRMSPPVAFQMRRIITPTEMEEITLNPGDHVVINASRINRDPGAYPQPNHFRPERWSDISTSPMQPLAFSAGPRRCLGFNFAMMVLRSSLFALFSDTEISVPSDSKIDVNLAITQGPGRVPMVLNSLSGNLRQSRFSGTAADQMCASTVV